MCEEYATRGRQQHPVAQQQHNHSVRPRVFKLVIFQEQHQHLFSNILTCQHTYVYAHPHLHGAAGPARRRSWWPLCKHGLDNCENWEVCYYTFSVTEIITQRVLWSAIFKNTQTLPQLAGLCTYHFLGAALIALVKPYLGRLYFSIPFPNMYI